MKNIILFSTILFLLFSCEKDNPVVGKENSVLTEEKFTGARFSDWDSFNERVIYLQGQNNENSVLYEVAQEGYTSFLEVALKSDIDKELKIADELTLGLMGIFNRDLQFQVGEKIISYKDGNFYESDMQFSSFEAIDNIKVSSIVLESPEKDSDRNLTATLYVGGSNTAGYSHRDFNMNRYRRCSDNASIYGPGSRTMRYTQQLKSFWTGYTHFLFIETKLYWRNRRNKTRYADGEERTYTYNVSGTLGHYAGPYNNLKTVPVNFQKTVTCTRNRYNQQQIGRVFPVSSNHRWNVNLTGTITHKINGDSSSNTWVAPVNWR